VIITYNEKSKKFFKRSLIAILIMIVIFIISLIALRYEVEGENINKMPFIIESVAVASKIDIEKNNDTNNYWNFNPIQINDVYIKIEKNENKNEKIKSIKIKNFKIKKSSIGNGKIIPIVNDYTIDNMETIEYKASQVSNLENLVIGKDGGTIGFRYIIQDLGNFTSNDEEITYNMEILEKMGITRENIQTKINFDLIIEQENDINYITNLTIDVPTKEKNIENVDISNIIFKRLLQN